MNRTAQDLFRCPEGAEDCDKHWKRERHALCWHRKPHKSDNMCDSRCEFRGHDIACVPVSPNALAEERSDDSQQRLVEQARCPFCQGSTEPGQPPVGVTQDCTRHCLQCGLWSAPNAHALTEERSDDSQQRLVGGPNDA